MKAIGMNITRTLKKPSAVYLPPLMSQKWKVYLTSNSVLITSFL